PLRPNRFFFFQAEDGIRAFHVWSSDVCSSDLQWGDLRYGHVMLPHHTANQDIALWCFEDHDGLEADLNYSADIMSPESGARMRRCFLALLEALRRDPSIAIGDANLLDGEDRALLASWNSTDAAWPPQRTLASLLQ